MATINGVEVIGDKTAHDFDLLDKNDGVNLANGIERNREATEDNHEDIVRHRTDTDVHVTPEWKNSLVTKEILGLYWTAAQTADIINEISIAGGAKLVKVDALPTVGLEQTIYLVPKTDPQAGDVFDEYVWVDGKYEFIGTTKADLSNYATKTELNAKQDALSNQQLSNIADVTNKANDADVVHKSGDETIDGVKNFKNTIIRNVGNFTAGETPTAQVDCVVLQHTNNGGTVPANSILSHMFANGDTMCELLQSPCIGSLARTWFRTNTDGSYSIYSFTKNGSLGTSGYKWKDVQSEKINGLNPGALSLPSISNTGANAWIAIDTTNWVKQSSASAAQKYTPLADGWLNVRVDNATLLAISVGGNYLHQMIRSETANSLALLMPVYKNEQVAIMVGGNENLAYNRVTFYYCQGNV